jgi:hypothetical protein
MSYAPPLRTGRAGAGKPHARICEGEAEWPSYSTGTVRNALERDTTAASLHIERCDFAALPDEHGYGFTVNGSDPSLVSPELERADHCSR